MVSDCGGEVSVLRMTHELRGFDPVKCAVQGGGNVVRTVDDTCHWSLAVVQIDSLRALIDHVSPFLIFTSGQTMLHVLL